jgi:hypothetical protein
MWRWGVWRCTPRVKHEKTVATLESILLCVNFSGTEFIETSCPCSSPGTLISSSRLGHHCSLDFENDHLEIIDYGMEFDNGKVAR